MSQYLTVMHSGALRILLFAAVILLAGCCLSGREGQRFAGSADIIPIPGEIDGLDETDGIDESEEGLIAGEESVGQEEEQEITIDAPEDSTVAPDLPPDWLDAFKRFDAVVYFDYDLASLKTAGVRILQSWIGALKRYPQADLVVQGHTDSRGTRGYNLWLGERRAKSVQDFLVIRGISEKRIRIVSYGEEVPAVSGNNERSHALNRRAVLSVEPAQNR